MQSVDKELAETAYIMAFDSRIPTLMITAGDISELNVEQSEMFSVRVAKETEQVNQEIRAFLSESPSLIEEKA